MNSIARHHARGGNHRYLRKESRSWYRKRLILPTAQTAEAHAIGERSFHAMACPIVPGRSIL
jgi:hypothetical protein